VPLDFPGCGFVYQQNKYLLDFDHSIEQSIFAALKHSILFKICGK
jgi:hypothetical protein